MLDQKSRTDAGGLGLGGTSPGSDASNNVRVCLRVRPLLPFERNAGDSVNASVLADERTVRLTSNQATYNQQVESLQFRLDHCVGPSVNQQDFFHGSGVEAFCDSALEGQAATVFCFGQTGSGKTYTMSGPHLADDIDQYFSRELKRKEGVALGGGYENDEDHVDVHMETAGLQYRGVHYIASTAAKINAKILQDLADQGEDTNFTPITIRASYLEIYQESVNDLLNETEGLKVRWAQGAQSFFVEKLLIVTCDDVGDLMAVLSQGGGNRKRAAHKLNVDSSRSHVLFTLYIERRERADAPAKYGKINFVDLAGSEKLKDSESTGVNADETKSINTSLFTLGKVIAALSKRRTTTNKSGGGGAGQDEEIFVPYRDSSLTKLLMDSLGGSCRTLMIACISPAFRFTDESVRTIKYAMRTRNIVNAIPSVRMDPGQREVFELKQEVGLLKKENQRLREELALFRAGNGSMPAPPSSAPHHPAVESYRAGGVGGGPMPDSAAGTARLPLINMAGSNRPAPHTTTYIEEDATLDGSTSRSGQVSNRSNPRSGGGAAASAMVSPHRPAGVSPTGGGGGVPNVRKKVPASTNQLESSSTSSPPPLPPLSPTPRQQQQQSSSTNNNAGSQGRSGGQQQQRSPPPPNNNTANKKLATAPKVSEPQKYNDGDDDDDDSSSVDGTVVVGEGTNGSIDTSTFSNRRQLGGRLPTKQHSLISTTSTTVLPQQQRHRQFPVTQDEAALMHVESGTCTRSDNEPTTPQDNHRRHPPPPRQSNASPKGDDDGGRGGAVYNQEAQQEQQYQHTRLSSSSATGGGGRGNSITTLARKSSSSRVSNIGEDEEGGGGDSSYEGGTRNTAGLSLNPDGSVGSAAWSEQPTASAKDVGKKFGFKPAKKK